jgi:HEAT repeat protein
LILIVLLLAPGCFSPHMPSVLSQPQDASDQVRWLITSLYNPDPQVRAQACQALQDRDDAEPAIPYLLGLLYDDAAAWIPTASDCYARTNVGSEAATALGNIGSPAVGPLLAILQSDAPDKVRIRAVTSLENARDRRAIPALIEALETKDQELHSACILALQRITGMEFQKDQQWRDWEWQDWLKQQGLRATSQRS